MVIKNSDKDLDVAKSKDNLSSKIQQEVVNQENKQLQPTSDDSSTCIEPPKAEEVSQETTAKQLPKKKTPPEKNKKTKQKTKLNKEEPKEKNRLFEQAILMLKYDQLKQYSENNNNFGGKRFNNIARLILQGDENPTQILNDIFRRKINFDLLLNATSPQLSCLVPMVRIYKQYSTNNGKNVLNLELPLIQQYEIEDMQTIFKDKNSRGGGVGLRSVNMRNIGGGSGLTPATSEIYDLDLDLVFADFSELIKLRYTYQPTKEDMEAGFIRPIEVRYSDLFHKRIKDSSNLDQLENFRIKIVLGWYVPKNTPTFIEQSFIDEIENMQQEFYLTFTKHNIDFDERGVTTLKMNFKTYLDASINRPDENNLLFDPFGDPLSGKDDRKQKLDERKKYIEKLSDPNITDNEKNKIQELLKKLEEEITKLSKPMLEEKYRRFINNIYDKNKIYFTFLEYEDYKNYESLINTISERKKSYIEDQKELEQLVESTSRVKSYNSSVNQLKDSSQANTLSKIPSFDQKDFSKQFGNELIKTSKEVDNLINLNFRLEDKKLIPFFYLGDLIDSVLEDGVFGNGKFIDKKLKVMLGPMYFYDFGDITKDSLILPLQGVENKNDSKKSIKFSSKGKIINIADIPISLNLYQQWFIEEIVNKGTVILTFDAFMKSILENLIRTALTNNVYPWAPSQPSTITAKQVIFTKNDEKWINEEDNTDYTREHFLKNNNSLYMKNKFNTNEELDYLYYVTAVNMAANRFNSNYEEDIKIGVRHLYFQNENGFVKNIKFSKQTNPYLEAHSIVTAGSNVTLNLMTGVYNAKVSMFGNSFFRVGEYVYIEPTIGSIGVRDNNVKIDNQFSEKFDQLSASQFAKKLGIGGYYMVTKVDSKIGIAEYDTEVQLTYQFSGDERGNVDYQVGIAEIIEKTK